MNALINNAHPVYQPEESIENSQNRTFGDLIAVSVVGFYTISAFVISSWSALLFLSGDRSNGGPIGLLVDFMHSSGIL